MTAKRSFVLVFPMPSNVTNPGSRSHWALKGREKKRYLEQCDERQNAGLIPPPPRVPFARALVSSVMHLGAHMDDDNAMARHKSILDWLKTRGYIVDDRRACIRWTGFPEQEVRRDGDYRIELTLTEAA